MAVTMLRTPGTLQVKSDVAAGAHAFLRCLGDTCCVSVYITTSSSARHTSCNMQSSVQAKDYPITTIGLNTCKVNYSLCCTIQGGELGLVHCLLQPT
eukprot:jgi/Botrbrau1/4025/Bobra.0016s0032.1